MAGSSSRNEGLHGCFLYALQAAQRSGARSPRKGRNLILLGKSGRGKTHLAVDIVYRSIQNSFMAFFGTAATLIDEFSVGTTCGKLPEALAVYLQPHVLVVDTVGYMSYGPDAANLFFHLVNERYLRRKPVIFTTNRSPLTAWGEVLHDHDLAEILVDRELEKVRLIVLDGSSYRTRYLELDGGKGIRQSTAIISGIHSKPA